jgi:hypothetical protein
LKDERTTPYHGFAIYYPSYYLKDVFHRITGKRRKRSTNDQAVAENNTINDIIRKMTYQIIKICMLFFLGHFCDLSHLDSQNCFSLFALAVIELKRKALNLPST